MMTTAAGQVVLWRFKVEMPGFADHLAVKIASGPGPDDKIFTRAASPLGTIEGTASCGPVRQRQGPSPSVIAVTI